jgi:hypothetical protein
VSHVTLAQGALAVTGTWTKVQASFPNAPGNPGNIALLGDGRVLASGPETSNVWYTLTPGGGGNYVFGSWSTVESSNQGRLFNPAFVLRDGRYVNCGGEYVLDDYERRLHPNGTDRANCEIFDPATDSWSSAPSMPQTVADTPAAELADGRILNLSYVSSNSYLLSSFGVSPSWASAAAYNQTAIDSEGGCLLLPDTSVFCGNKQFRRYLPSSNSWVSTATTPGLATGEFLLSPTNGEIGAHMLLHSGKALVLGANQHNGLYTPPTTFTGAGSWQLAADTPSPFNHADAPATVEPDGKVFTATTTDSSGLGGGVVTFYEYDPGANTWAQVANPPGVTFPSAERTRMLNLPSTPAAPTGLILVTGTNDGSAWLYQPLNTPQTSWKPTITSISAPSSGVFTLTGTQLNGLTTGAAFGDDGLMQTNYPIVWLGDTSGNVYFAKAFNVDQMAPRKATTGSVKFTLPVNIPNGTYNVHVSANGVDSSNTVPLTVSGRHVTALTGPAGGADIGSTTTWFVILSAPAPAGGTVVNLSSSAPSVATLPASITIAQGGIRWPVNVTTRGFGKAVLSAVTAVSNSQFKAATAKFGWTIRTLGGPPDAPNQPAPPIIYGSSGTSWTVSIDPSAPPNGLNVNLGSSNPSLASVPSLVTIPGGATAASFPVTNNFVEGLTTITASVTSSSMSRVEAVGEKLRIGTTDFFKCSDENQTCLVGDAPSSTTGESQPPRLVAFGANGVYNFALTARSMPCNINNIPDPLPGVFKACYFAPYAFWANDGAVLNAPASVNVAYGANGYFAYGQMSGTFTCNASTFNYSGAFPNGDPTAGVAKGCYYAPVGYDFGGAEGSALTLGTNTPIAYGANGVFVYKVLSGSVACSNTTFGDPAPGVGKTCYVFRPTFAANEGQSYSSPGAFRTYYGSGLNSAFMSSAQVSGSCNNSVFGDPDVGHFKHCWTR